MAKKYKWLVFAAFVLAITIPVMVAMVREHADFFANEDRLAAIRNKAESDAENDPEKAFELANRYHQARNTPKSMEWLEKAARWGNLKATRELVTLAAQERNVGEFHRWLKLASTQGDGESAFTLACEFAHLPSRQEDQAAFSFLERAAELGYENAKSILDEAEQKGMNSVRGRLKMTLESDNHAP